MKLCFVFFLFFLATSKSADLRRKRNVADVKTGEAIPNTKDNDCKDGNVKVACENSNDNIQDEDDKKKKGNENVPNTGNQTPESNNQIGTFWHLTDVHWDSHYNLNANNELEICPSSNGAAPLKPGPYGDYRCDSPWKLVNSSIYAMKEKSKTNPDFILWTGDNTFHTNDESLLGENEVFDIIEKVTELIDDVFPGIDVIPVLGNHDFHPKNQMPIGQSSLLTRIANLWDRWLVHETIVFQDGGYYSLVNKKIANLQIVVLNTNLWYSSNKKINTTVDRDPGGQFAFLQSILERAVDDEMKIYIVGHIPPGYFELVDYKYWLYPEYNTRYVELVKQYNHVILGQFFGHHHTDSFRIFEHNGRSVSTAFIAPGVSPWMTTLPGVEDGANNPGIRKFEFDKETLELKDYVQYYLDLKKANADGPEWVEEYRATTAYGLSDIGNARMDELYKQIKEANLSCTTCEDYQIIQRYAKFNSVSYNSKKCDEDCLRRHACAISELEQKGYDECVYNGAPTFKFSQIWALLILLALFVTNWNC